eukprot:10879237-Alexandrium_andersonii.AAC.1
MALRVPRPQRARRALRCRVPGPIDALRAPSRGLASERLRASGSDGASGRVALRPQSWLRPPAEMGLPGLRVPRSGERGGSELRERPRRERRGCAEPSRDAARPPATGPNPDPGGFRLRTRGGA